MRSIIPRALTLLLALFSILFVVMGLRWLVNPAGSAPHLSGLIALVSRNRIWFYPPAMLLLFAASGRTVAWVVHGADFALQSIVFEILVASLFLIGSKVLAER